MGKGAGAGDYAEEKLSEYELERLRRIKASGLQAVCLVPRTSPRYMAAY